MKRKRYTDEEVASLTPRSLGRWMGQGLGLLRIARAELGSRMKARIFISPLQKGHKRESTS